MKEKFTKDEWVVSTEPESEHYLITVDCGESMSIPIITSALYLSYYDTEEREANAHLIAAAPDMYEMLKRIERHITESNNEIELADSIVCNSHEINKLLAKAIGESNE